MVLVRTKPLMRHRASAWPSASMMREMESLIRDFTGDRTASREQRAFPAVNVTHDPEHYYLRAELPGMDPEQLDLSVDQNKVTVRGTLDTPAEETDVSFHRRERLAGTFARTVTLPSDIATDEVEASYRHGVLNVTVPKAPEAKPRQIEVKSS